MIAVTIFLSFCLVSTFLYFEFKRNEERRREDEKLEKVLKFEEDVKVALSRPNNLPTWADIKTMGERDNLSKQDILVVLNKIYREVLVGDINISPTYRERVNTYINSCRDELGDESVYSDLPKALHRPLDNLISRIENIPDYEVYLEPLTDKIKELYKEKQEETAIMKKYAILGIVIGVASIIMTVLSLLFGS